MFTKRKFSSASWSHHSFERKLVSTIFPLLFKNFLKMPFSDSPSIFCWQNILIPKKHTILVFDRELHSHEPRNKFSSRLGLKCSDTSVKVLRKFKKLIAKINVSNIIVKQCFLFLLVSFCKFGTNSICSKLDMVLLHKNY